MAIDSVGADFLNNEPAVTGSNPSAADITNENYQHEAGLIEASPQEHSTRTETEPPTQTSVSTSTGTTPHKNSTPATSESRKALSWLGFTSEQGKTKAAA